MSSDSSNSGIKVPLRTDRLREAREKQGFSQRQLARVCGIGELQIYRYESGATDPAATTLAVIARVLGVSTDYLLDLSDDFETPGLANLRPDEQKLLRAYTMGDTTTIIELVADRTRLLAREKKEVDTDPSEN